MLPDDSPYTTGGIGLLGTAPSADAMKECDTLLLAGTNFPYLEFLPKPGKARACRSTSIRRASDRATRSRSAWWATAGACWPRCCRCCERKTDRGFLERAQKRMGEWNELMESARNARHDADEAAGRRRSP